MTTWIIGYKAKPDLDSPHFGKVACAFCTFWVLSDNKEEAKKRALDFGEKCGWIFSNWEVCHITHRMEWVNDPEATDRFDRAQREGIAGIFNFNEKDPTANN